MPHVPHSHTIQRKHASTAIRTEDGKNFQHRFFEFAIVFVYLAAVSFLLLWPALWNGYPLVFSDTGTYTFSAFSLIAPLDRPMGYSYFIRFFSQGASLWFVVYAQAFFTSYLLWKLLRIFFEKRNFLIHFLTVAGLASLTIASWIVSQVMVDIFPALILLIVAVFLFGKTKFFEKIFLILLLFFFSITHAANFLLCLAVLFFVFLFVYFRKSYLHERCCYLKKIALLGAVAFCAPLFFLLSNYQQGYGLVLNPSTHVFMMSRANESGVLGQFLQENCQVKHYDLCLYQGHFLEGDQFIWGRQSPPNIMGWQESKPEYDEVLHKIFADPRYDAIFFTDSAFRSAKLFFMFGMDNLAPYNGPEPVYVRIEKYFPQELKAYISAQQFQGRFFNVDAFALFFIVVAWASLVYIGWRVWKRNLDLREQAFVFMVFVFLAVNAAVMATLSGVYGRYQERLVWLVPLTAFILFLKEFFNNKRRKV